MLIFWGALSVLNDARHSNNTRAYQWKLDKQHLRALSKAQLDLEREKTQIEVRVGKGGTAQFGDISNTQTNIVNLDMTAVALMAYAGHFEEFVRALSVRGAERSEYLMEAGAPQDFQFADGKRMTRGEYNFHRRLALTTGMIAGTGKGRKSRVIKDVSPSE